MTSRRKAESRFSEQPSIDGDRRARALRAIGVSRRVEDDIREFHSQLAKPSFVFHRTLTIVCGGATTISRTAHLKKLLTLLGPLFSRVRVITEDMPVFILESGTKTYYPIPSIHADSGKKKPFPQRLLAIVQLDCRKAGILLSCVSGNDIVLFLGVYQAPSLLAAKLRGASTILFGGGFDIGRSRSNRGRVNPTYFSARWLLQIAMLALFDRVILESPAVERFFRLERFHAKLLLHGHLFVPSSFARVKPIDHRDFDVAYVGALTPEKGIDEFLESISIMARQNPIRVLIVGDGAARNRIALHSSTLGSGAVIKHLHYVEYEDMPLVFNNVRLLVLPSHSEGLPNVVIEAMACGTPVLATDVGAIPDIIEDGDNGFLLKSSDPNLIAERITGLLGDPSRLESVGANASSFIERRFSLEATRATWRTLFSAVCPSDPAKIASSKPQDSR